MEVNINAGDIESVTTETHIVCRIKNNYGLLYVYPVCQKAKAFAHLVGKKTLSPNDLKDISFLGFSVGFNNVPESAYEEYNKRGFVGFQRFLDNWRG